ncbi:MAG: hypothetical protein ACR2G6_04580 [Gemmatimonadaceae bacterium]
MKKLLVAFTALALSTAAPAVSAQFTATVIPPKKPRAEETATETTPAVAAKDTTLSEKLTDMKAWVDSAAVALAANPSPAVSDSAPSSDAATSADTASVTREHTGKPHVESPAKFKDGAPAPDTATPIPLLLLAGAGLMAAGSWIRRR